MRMFPCGLLMLARANSQYQCQGLEPQPHVLEKTLPKREQVLVEGVLSVGHSVAQFAVNTGNYYWMKKNIT